ncbi:MAG: hypothetical protein J6D47_10170 [Peptostreptococcaceae bacterium]|nr:hypothetical protein [Peptostreptococcaceae bacterium]
MNTKLATILTVSGIATGLTIGGTIPIMLLSGGIGVSIAEIISILEKYSNKH